jgi:hypothetical protein
MQKKKKKKKKKGASGSHLSATQEGCGLKPALANSSLEPISRRKTITKKDWRAAQSVGPDFKPQYCKNK